MNRTKAAANYINLIWGTDMGKNMQKQTANINGYRTKFQVAKKKIK